MIKQIRIFIIEAILLSFVVSPVAASQIWFDPIDQFYDIGDTLSVELYADIDESDAIFGFGFDLSFDGGATYASGPGASGSYLTFTGFTPDSTYFQYDTMLPPFWDDGDTIAGEVPWGKPVVWGTDILLGTFYFDAPSAGPIGIENLYLGPLAGDYGIFGEEGLLGATALMPNNPQASVSPIPEPATLLLLTAGMICMGAFGRKKFRQSKVQEGQA